MLTSSLIHLGKILTYRIRVLTLPSSIYVMAVAVVIVFLRYLWEVLKHKYFIIVAGFQNDISKLGRSEFWPYAEYFCGSKDINQKKHDAFHVAWLHHVAHNDHHCEHFISNYSQIAKQLRNNSELAQNYLREMPDDAILELLVDNVAATRSYEGYWPNGEKKDGWTYMTKYFNHYVLHPKTRIKFGALLCALGYTQVLPNEFDWTQIYRSDISSDDRMKLAQLKALAN
ncbi:unnamed protein product [Rotaria magnacalcarata]|uniref:Uncharacterized protein n=1 Tax=Rotaria magnacalcarata TaxID=392030 RepID=A0A815VSV8_9BILA|nr:unnamed protein product [Rotaria magnacalcarata]CAF1534383.1 unnamed protein product [Rotaria magnacalcarata]CAF4006449.1 unnamed protein product [Rotaria magnacalcarata]CAF4143875.1 unnamed protein product [Rotaria magnacalcarata]